MTARIKLVRLLPDSDQDIAELQRQRILCGWGLDDVPQWVQQVKDGLKGLYWIFPSEGYSATIPEVELLSMRSGTGPPPPSKDFQPLGHISLDWEDYHHDTSLCDRSEHRATIATFFILRSQQGTGLGSRAMDAVEALAASAEFNVKTLTLNTLSAEFASDPAFWEMLGAPYDPKARLNEHWYASRGYKAYKRESRYDEKDKNGKLVKLVAVFMKKELVIGQDV